MGPAIPVLLLLMGLGVIGGCSGDGGKGGTTGPDGNNDADAAEPDADADAGTDTETGTDTGSDPCDRLGFNAKYFKCEISSECDLIDLDIKNNSILKMMTGKPVNRMGHINIDASDPMGYDTATTANFGVGNQFFIGATFNGYGDVKPIQVAEISSDGINLVPFSYDGEIDSSSAVRSGIAFIDSETSPAVSPSIQGIDAITIEPLNMYPVGIQGGVLYNGSAGARMGIAGNEYITGNGLFKSYGFTYAGVLNQNENPQQFPVLTSGDNACAIAMVSDTEVAVLNAKGGTESWQLDGSSIDIIDTTISAAATNDSEAANAISATIPLGAGVEVMPFPELPISSDGSYVFAIGGTGGDMTTLYVADLETHSVVATLELGEFADEVLGIDIMDDTIALTIIGAAHREEAGVGDILTIDISNPTAPDVDKHLVGVGYGLGPIAMHEESGKIYIKAAAQAPWPECADEVPGENYPRNVIISIDPLAATSY